ncbi:uncharacterized protein LOC131239271 [Magnolia sinica]|uniref:uncharacterized protein LOC131239271 n=1 Tax=Magnolia sinica TaxID=86752 RepID=UPI00265AAAD9|nr:uncharacterized protein LOC131239271 [Magnolia sinica]
MKYCSQWWMLSLAILLLTISVHASQALLRNENGVKTAVFLSPAFVLGPGSVEDKFYYNVDFPRGHIAVKDFNAEVVDEAGNPIPLHETYLHHWVMFKYYSRTSAVDLDIASGQELHLSKFIFARNAGVCQGTMLGQYYGLGSETRRTSTFVPDPYGIEVGNPAEIPNGYEERWFLNVHAIDTRGVVDRMGCTECRCNLYNVTEDSYGRPLRKDYTGGLSCCYDQAQCRVREGIDHVKRKLYLRYTVKWVDWDDSIVPVKIYIFDVTDSGKRENSTKENALIGCRVEYNVEPCGAAGMDKGLCVDTKKTNVVMPRGGNIIYGVAHQHWGGIGGTVYGQDGRVICSSIPIYGNGKEAGNEDGYIVGMSTCYPKPGSVKIADGEVLTFESNYSSTQMHTGVMGLFYLLVADPPRKNVLSLRFPAHDSIEFSKYTWAVVFAGMMLALVIAAVSYRRRTNEKDGGYQPIV